MLDRWLDIARLRLRSLLRRSDVEQDLDDELHYHIERQMEEHMARGMSEPDARRAALIALGGVEQRKEQSRDARGTRLIEDLLKDVRYTLRTLRRSPGFTTVTILTLALGIGANTAIFSLLDAVVLRDLAVRDPKSLVIVQRMARAPDGNIAPRAMSWPAFQRLAQDSSVLERSAALTTVSNISVRIGSELTPAPRGAIVVSGDFFPMLGVGARLGRLIEPSDATNPVVVLGHTYWATRFAGDETVVGKSLEVNGTPLTVIGVTSEEFTGVSVGTNPDLYLPMAMLWVAERTSPTAALRSNRSFLSVLGRLESGISLAEASQRLKPVYVRALIEASGGVPDSASLARLQETSIEVQPGRQGLAFMRTQFGKPLQILMGMVALLLLIACGNIANLLAARASAKRREVGVRLSMGAGRGRLVRQLLTESVGLAVAGGALGLIVAHFGTRLLMTMFGQSWVSFALDVRPDARVLAFAFGASLITAVIFGLAPAMSATRLDLANVLREGGRGALGGRGAIRLGNTLVTTQVALSITLLVATGLFVRSLVALRNIDLGFQRDNIVLVKLDPRRSGYRNARLATFYEQVLERARALPGVVEGALADITPLSGSSSLTSIVVEGRVVGPGDRTDAFDVLVTPNYFRAVGQPLLAGTTLSPRADMRVPDVVVNETFARELGGKDVLGKRLGFGQDDSAPLAMRIVGIVKDAPLRFLKEERLPTVYVPALGQAGIGSASLVLRTSTAPTAIVNAVRRVLRELDPNVEILSTTTLADQVDATMVREQLVATLATFFGALALLLAAVGLYGVASQSVVRRTSEIGIRMALGAQRSAVRWEILRGSIATVVLGVAIGLPLSWVGSRAAVGLLYGVTPTDTATIVGCVATVVIVALVAAYVPARSASRIDPVIALRAD
jgi:predicted permease